MQCISVAICTWNRAKLLDQTLAQMRKLAIPLGVDWELLVVNNNCTDDTDAVIARHQDALPLRRLFEPNQGQSNARNCGIAAARGELLVWTDDDVLVGPEWLAAYHEAAKGWPEAGYFGGSIEPWYECPPPPWLLANVKSMAGMLLLKDLGPNERLLTRAEVPFGANMAFRTDLLRENVFDPRLGLTGNDNIRNDESMLFRSLISKGVKGVWVPGARVRHFVTKQRLTRRYLWDYNHGFGRSCVRQEMLEQIPQTAKTWAGVPQWVIRQAVESWVAVQWRRFRGRDDWVPEYVRLAYSIGAIHEVIYQKTAGWRARAIPHTKAAGEPTAG
jgi:glycosyltransferase involved in cell wall biosynthesis